jgi:membrane-bound lytic murein transglycosylase MltF
MTNVNSFGQIDDRVITEEPDMEWVGNDSEFTPLNVVMDDELQEFTFYLCKTYNLDFAFVMAVIQHESQFNASKVSATNDFGLMQINQGNHEWLSDTLGVTDFLDPEQNIRAGCFVLRKLFEEYGDASLVLMSYNMGETNASRLWKKGIYSTDYTESIFQIQEEFETELQRKGEGQG